MRCIEKRLEHAQYLLTTLDIIVNIGVGTYIYGHLLI